MWRVHISLHNVSEWPIEAAQYDLYIEILLETDFYIF